MSKLSHSDQQAMDIMDARRAREQGFEEILGNGWMVIENGEGRHVVPINDLKDHPRSLLCWCHPFRDHRDPNVFVHNSMDRREEYEEGRKPS